MRTTVLLVLLLSAVTTMTTIVTFGIILHWVGQNVQEEYRHGGETPHTDSERGSIGNGTLPWPWHTYRNIKITLNHSMRCDLLANGDVEEQSRVKSYLTRERSRSDTSHSVTRTTVAVNCSTLVGEFSDSFYVSAHEREYPLAYAITVSEQSTTTLQYLRHLKVIYRPHNTYCYHVDRKSSEAFANTFELLTKCFNNIHTSLQSVNVYHGNASILNAQMYCYDTLMNKSQSWEHVINLCGTELPLKTNREIVKLLRPLRGLNVITNPKMVQDGTTEQHIVHRLVYRAVWNEDRRHAILGKDRLGPLPIKFPVWKAITYMALTRKFIAFLQTDSEAIALYKYLQDVQSPEEFFYSTMNQRKGSPGGFYEAEDKNVSCNIPIVEAFWKHRRGRSHSCIDQYYIHEVCIVSISDLPNIVSKSAPFFNKYLMSYDYIVMDCAEQAIKLRNVKEYERDWGLVLQ